MPSNTGRPDRPHPYAALGLLLLPLLCCGLPLLIAAGALGGLGAVLSSPWLIATAVLLIGGATWLVRRRRNTGDDENCCPPGSATRRQARHTGTPPRQPPES